MSAELYFRLLSEIESIPLIDPHSHINPHSACSSTLADILGYHYYTELAHSTGLPKAEIEQEGLDPKEKVSRLVPYLANLENTAQYSWLVEMCQQFFDFGDDLVTESNWEELYDTSEAIMANPDWEETVLDLSGLDAVFLTNDFDDPLSGFDTEKYIPCLRTDDLVFHFTKSETRERLQRCTEIDIVDVASLKAAFGQLFEHFTKHGAKACAISLPPSFSPRSVTDAEVEPVLNAVLSGKAVDERQAEVLSCHNFWKLAEYCHEYRLPFDLMIGVNRGVYPEGVFQGRDLFDQRVSLIQYKELFNAFPSVTFPVSVLAQTSNQELVSYAWIFPNVVTNGHWWYSNIPAFIEPDCRSRLQAVPQTKQIGYYSDMYKLEFGLPKFAMYRRVLTSILVNDFVLARGWSEDRALLLGWRVLRGNVESIFDMT